MLSNVSYEFLLKLSTTQKGVVFSFQLERELSPEDYASYLEKI